MHICIIDMDFEQENLCNFQKIFEKIDTNIVLTILRHDTYSLLRKISKLQPDGIIITGSKSRILHKTAIRLPSGLFELNIPILGICYGYQWITKELQGKIATFEDQKLHTYRKVLEIKDPFYILSKLYEFTHHDYIDKPPPMWKSVIQNGKQHWMAYDHKHKIMGIQFHPEKHIASGVAFFTKWLHWIHN